MAEKKLSVKDLQISFRTNAGKVQAVREISFDLYKGETLAIVGESGSGKSVTSRAIMGILAGNAIVEGGKILYGDKDLLKVTEEEFHRIRGDKIAMVFQDPLSSLNPIMKIGQQLTEAMLLKNKASRKESKGVLKKLLKNLELEMEAAGVSDAKESVSRFSKIVLKQCELEASYGNAFSAAAEARALSENALLKLEKNSMDGFGNEVASVKRAANAAKDRFVVYTRAEELAGAVEQLSAVWKEYRTAVRKKQTDPAAETKLTESLRTIFEITEEAGNYPVPDFFAIGFHVLTSGESIPEDSVSDMNERFRKECEESFLKHFRENTDKAELHAVTVTDEKRKKAVEVLRDGLPAFTGEPKKAAVDEAAKRMKEAVSLCINPLEIVKDSITYTFPTSLDYAIDLYFTGEEKNLAEEKRYRKMQAKYDAIVKKGKKPDWQVIPAGLVNLPAARQDMEDTVTEMLAHLTQQLSENEACYPENSEEIIRRTDALTEYLSNVAAESVYRVTKSVAREKAIKLMESVGIDNPRKRFNQYPFEFSGGMRQRIVIAIALTANPDILICDEPTTALDVTIQAQILELINNLKRERNLSVIFITHDLGVVANMADRIAVMYAGKIVECGTSEDIFYDPRHPYTWALLSSVPDLDTKGKLESIPGTPPNMIYPPKGDAFAARNKYALEIDFEEQPPMFPVSETHSAATWLLHPNAPKLDPPEIVTERIARMKKMREENE